MRREREQRPKRWQPSSLFNNEENHEDNGGSDIAISPGGPAAMSKLRTRRSSGGAARLWELRRLQPVMASGRGLSPWRSWPTRRYLRISSEPQTGYSNWRFRDFPIPSSRLEGEVQGAKVPGIRAHEGIAHLVSSLPLLVGEKVGVFLLLGEKEVGIISGRTRNLNFVPSSLGGGGAREAGVLSLTR